MNKVTLFQCFVVEKIAIDSGWNLEHDAILFPQIPRKLFSIQIARAIFAEPIFISLSLITVVQYASIFFV